jgi:hypothetical protein
MKKTNVPDSKPTSPPSPDKSDKAHKPALPIVFKKPQMNNPFAKGFKIRQDGKGQFFSRTRRGI